MTGYSSCRSEEPEFSLGVSLKSTNHRYLDLQVRLPAGFDPLEPVVRRLVNSHVARGHLEVVVSFGHAGEQTLELNRPLLAAYVAACRSLRGEFGAVAPPDPVALLRIPGMIAGSNAEISPEVLGRIQPVLERLAEQALVELDAMRAGEGRALDSDLRTRLSRLRALADGVGTLAAHVPGLYRRRLEERLKEITGGTAGGAAFDPGRLAQEVLYLASRADVAEELTRLVSHLAQAEQLLNEGAEVGKKLDFLLQEMNREANTILSKTTDVPGAGPEIARQAIEMKTEIEKLREQAQNIE